MASNDLIEGVKYITYSPPKVIEYSTDNGQCITERVDFCTRWECQRWEGSRAIAPVLFTNDRGFRVCSACGCSYGSLTTTKRADTPVIVND